MSCERRRRRSRKRWVGVEERKGREDEERSRIFFPPPPLLLPSQAPLRGRRRSIALFSRRSSPALSLLPIDRAARAVRSIGSQWSKEKGVREGRRTRERDIEPNVFRDRVSSLKSRTERVAAARSSAFVAVAAVDLDESRLAAAPFRCSTRSPPAPSVKSSQMAPPHGEWERELRHTDRKRPSLFSPASAIDDDDRREEKKSLQASPYLGRSARRGSGASGDAARGERRGQACGASETEGHRGGSEAGGSGGAREAMERVRREGN